MKKIFLLLHLAILILIMTVISWILSTHPLSETVMTGMLSTVRSSFEEVIPEVFTFNFWTRFLIIWILVTALFYINDWSLKRKNSKKSGGVSL